MLPSDLAAISPFEVALPSRLVTPLRPLTRIISTALSKSPAASSKAFLQSTIPAAVASRSLLTSAAEYDTYAPWLSVGTSLGASGDPASNSFSQSARGSPAATLPSALFAASIASLATFAERA